MLKKICTAIQRPSAILQIILMSLLLTLILWDSLWHLSYGYSMKNVNQLVYSFEAFLSLPLLFAVDPKQRKWSIPLLLGFLWMIIVSFIPGLDTFQSSLPVIYRSYVLIMVMLLIPSLLDSDNLTRLIKSVLGIVLLSHAVMGILGIVSSYTGNAIPNFTSNYSFSIVEARLKVMFHPVTTGSIMCLSSLFALIGLAVTKKKFFRILFVVSFLITLFCLALSNARGPIISLGAALGVGLITILWKKFPDKQWLRVFLSLGSVILMVGVSVLFSSQLVNLFNVTRSAYQNGTLSMVSTASAEEEVSDGSTDSEVEEVVSFRTSGDTMNARFTVWKAALELIKNEPGILLTGTSFPAAHDKVNSYTGSGYIYSHVHNLWLQILVQMGIPGLLCLILFQIYLVQACFRVATSATLPLWERLLPMIPAAFFVGETVDCISLLTTYNYSLTWAMFACGCIFALDAHQQQAICQK